jgi:C-terminal processing protease CtpA/Prc
MPAGSSELERKAEPEIGDVGLITIRTLDGPPETMKQLERLAEDYPRHRRKRLLIFDLRGNSGGSDRAGAEVDRARPPRPMDFDGGAAGDPR